MKPVVGPLGAWFCTLLSIFAVVILSFIALMFRNGHEEFVGSDSDPSDGKAVARTIMWAVLVYAIFLVFCGSQVLLHIRGPSITLG